MFYINLPNTFPFLNPFFIHVISKFDLEFTWLFYNFLTCLNAWRDTPLRKI